MSLRSITVFLVSSCLTVAALIIAADMAFIWRFDMDYSDAGAVVGGEAADWSTGERPAWAFVPAWSYALVPMLAAGVFGSLHPAAGFWPGTRQRRGCE